METIIVRTKAKVELQDITQKVQDIVESSGVTNGVCHIFVPHTTAAIAVNEHDDPAVVEDIAAQLDTLAPQHRNYQHAEGNAPGHIKTSLVGTSETLFIENGKTVLGTWQGIFFCEFDGPRTRTVLVKIIADKP